MTISGEALIALTDEHEELTARSETLYDALTHAYAVAKKGRLAGADQEEALACVMEIAKRAKDQCDDMLNAWQQRGMEEFDAETMRLCLGQPFHMLSAEGKRRYVAARKRHPDSRSDSASAKAGDVTPDGTGVARSLSLHRDTE